MLTGCLQTSRLLIAAPMTKRNLLLQGTDDLRKPDEASIAANASCSAPGDQRTATAATASLPASLQLLADFQAAHPEVAVLDNPMNVAMVSRSLKISVKDSL